MSGDDIKRLQRQNEVNSAAIQRLNMQLQAERAKRPTNQGYHETHEEEIVNPPGYNEAMNDGYRPVDPQQVVIDHITQQATKKASELVANNIAHQTNAATASQARMKKLLSDFPSLGQEDSDLVITARDVYARLDKERPDLSQADKYERAVFEAASIVGARPVNAPIESYAAQDYVMPAGRNPALPQNKGSKSRLTPNIIDNAKLMGINVDPNTPEGKKNLAELSVYSTRFNADADEDHFRYR